MKKSWYGDNCCRCNGSNEPYMLNFNLWNKLTTEQERKECVCMTCIEQQLGRKLRLKDFLDAPINYGIFGFDCRVYVNFGYKFVLKNMQS